MIQYLAWCGVYGKHTHALCAMAREAQLNLGHWVRHHDAGLPDATGSLIYHETTASASTSYEPEVLPGLLQTESYIRALIAERLPGHDIELAVHVRRDRQSVLKRPKPAGFTFFVHERAFRLAVGGPATMHEQLLTLLLLDGLPHVTIRVVRASSGAETTFGGAFRLFEYASHRPLVYLDGPFVGLFLEDREYVDDYRALVTTIADIALNERQSREFIATLANDHDRERADPDACDRVEKEQL